MLYLDNGGNSLTGDGKFINCNDDDTSVFSVGPNGALTITDNVTTTAAAKGIDVVMSSATTHAKGISVTMDSLTTGDMLYLDNGNGSLTGDGKFINCNDDDTSVFSVGPNGALTITD